MVNVWSSVKINTRSTGEEAGLLRREGAEFNSEEEEEEEEREEEEKEEDDDISDSVELSGGN